MNYDSDTSYCWECSYFVLNVKLPYFPAIIEPLSIKMKRFCMHDVIGSEVGQCSGRRYPLWESQSTTDL